MFFVSSQINKIHFRDETRNETPIRRFAHNRARVNSTLNFRGFVNDVEGVNGYNFQGKA